MRHPTALLAVASAPHGRRALAWSRWMALAALSATAGVAAACGGGSPGASDAVADAAADGAGDTGPTSPRVVVNEVAPQGVPADWVELLNTGDGSVDLGGWTLADSDPLNTPFAFSAGATLAAGATLLVSRDDTGAAGFAFGLGPDDALTLRDEAGAEVDHVSWSAAGKVDALGRLPDGTGDLRPLYVPTPGRPNQAPGPRAVLLNEVSSSGDDAIELYNASEAAVSLDGWHLTDARGDDSLERYTFPVGTALEPGAFLVLRKDQDHAFGLGTDDAVVLYNDEGIVDLADWASGDAAVSFCRTPDGVGPLKPCGAVTWGAPNTP